MVYFPLLRSLRIQNYGMFPGPDQDGHFELNFNEGLTLVLGANGLGKTTLMMLIFRMIAGTYDLNLPAEIGNANLDIHELNRIQLRQFADRVNDGARQASAALSFTVGTTEFNVERELVTLKLQNFTIEGQAQNAEEIVYQTAILEAAGLGSYADWILILRTLVFFFEDRRALVWDPGAQRQLLRCLFLSPTQAGDWTKEERAILELDSRMRNLQAALQREQRERSKTVKKIESASTVQTALSAAQSHLSQQTKRRETLEELVESKEDERQSARLEALRAHNEHDNALRELERARLIAISALLPKADESLKFIYTRLISEEMCLVCNTHGVSALRESLESAFSQHRCLVCNSPLPHDDNTIVDIGDIRIAELEQRVSSTRLRSIEQARIQDEANAGFKKASEELASLSIDISDTREKINTLINQLPPDERKVNDQHQKLAAVQALVAELRSELMVARETFAKSLDKYREEIQTAAEKVKQQFVAAASGFLFEESGLSWVPIRRTVGQAGGMDPVEYPAFAVELTGSDFVGLQRRTSPSQVSESQREFIDLAFRMALVHVASPDHASTLAIDAPESSLDAVFVDKAAEVLGNFANSGTGSRLVITSNLGSGHLVSQLLLTIKSIDNRKAALVNLFCAGVPTRAMVESRSAYDRYWDNLLREVSLNDHY